MVGARRHASSESTSLAGASTCGVANRGSHPGAVLSHGREVEADTYRHRQHRGAQARLVRTDCTEESFHFFSCTNIWIGERSV